MGFQIDKTDKFPAHHADDHGRKVCVCMYCMYVNATMPKCHHAFLMLLDDELSWAQGGAGQNCAVLCCAVLCCAALR